MTAMQQPGPWLTCRPRPRGFGPGEEHGQPRKGHVCAPPPPSHCGGSQGQWILTGVRVDVPEPGGEECPDEEGTEGDAQDGSQPQPAVCRRTRPSALPRCRGIPFPPPFQPRPPSLPQTHCWAAASHPSPSPPGPSQRWWCSAEVEVGVRGEGGRPVPQQGDRAGSPQALWGLGMLLLAGLRHPAVWDKPTRLPPPMVGTSMVASRGGGVGVTHADLQAGLALEGGREGDAPTLGDCVGEAEAPDLPPMAAGGALQHGHPCTACLPTLHQQHRLPPRCCQPALLQLQVGRVVLPPHGCLPRGREGGTHRQSRWAWGRPDPPPSLGTKPVMVPAQRPPC